MEPKHSGLGISSFVIALLAGFGLIILFGIAGVMESSTPGGIDEESPQAVLLGLTLILMGGAEFLAGALGIAGLCQHNRKKVFAILGLVCSVLAVLGTGLLLLIGIAAGA